MTDLTAVVTAGGTREPIDDVRVVTNLSRGWFGAAIARALAERGVRVTLIGSRDLAREAHRVDPRVRLVPFDAFADLSLALDAATVTPPDLLFMAAAVSDYSPVRATGKLRSDQDALVVNMTKNPKLLARLRERCGPASTLVGFKLLSNVSRERLVEVAAKQARDNALDLTVANDLQRLGGDVHPVSLVTPDGAAEDLDGPREAVAEAIVARVLARRGVAGPGASDGDLAAWLAPRASVARVARVAASDALVLPDVVVTRPTGPGVPEARAVHAALARAAHEGRARRGAFAARLATGDALLGLDGPTPLDAHDEAARAALEAACAAAGVDARRVAAVPVLRAGGRVGLALMPRPGHPQAAQGTEVTSEPSLDDAPWVAPLLHPDARGRGLGEALARELDRRRLRVVAPLASAPFWVARGFRPLERVAPDLSHAPLDLEPAALDRLGAADDASPRGDASPRDGASPRGGASPRDASDGAGPLVLLEPPSRRDDLLAGASILLLDPVSRCVLLGRRKRDPWRDAWSLPGGRVEEGETPLAAALRELREETGIEAPSCEPVAEHEVVAGSSSRAFRIRCFVLLALGHPPGQETDELEPEWVPLDEARERAPLTPGVRGVLASLR